MLERPVFLQGVYSFEGVGLETPTQLQPPVSYKTPYDKRAQLTYFRAGNSTGEMIYFLIKRDGKPMRYFPVASKGAVHVSLAVVEDLNPDTVLEIAIAAPAGLKGSAVIDIGIVEI